MAVPRYQYPINGLSYNKVSDTEKLNINLFLN